MLMKRIGKREFDELRKEKKINVVVNDKSMSVNKTGVKPWA